MKMKMKMTVRGYEVEITNNNGRFLVEIHTGYEWVDSEKYKEILSQILRYLIDEGYFDSCIMPSKAKVYTKDGSFATADWQVNQQ